MRNFRRANVFQDSLHLVLSRGLLGDVELEWLTGLGGSRVRRLVGSLAGVGRGRLEEVDDPGGGRGVGLVEEGDDVEGLVLIHGGQGKSGACG